jgi:Lamin Tail Domain
MIRTSVFLKISVVAALAASTLIACDPETETPDQTGTLTFELQAAPGISLNAVSYAVSGNGFNKAGSINVAQSQTISGRVGDIPPGNGYLLSLSSVGLQDPRVRCEGSANFNVVAGTTTLVNVQLRCRLPARTGGVTINGTINVCPRIDSIDVLPAEATVGGSFGVSAVAVDVDGVPTALSYVWTSPAGPTTGTGPSALIACQNPGMTTLTLAVSDGDCSETVSVPVVCSALATADAGVTPVPVVIRINEVESSGGIPGDWAEIFNAGATPVDVSGWVFKDNNDLSSFVIPMGTVVAAGGYLVLDESVGGSVGFSFGLGSGDTARLYDATGALVDSYLWTAHAATTYGRCPNGTGAFATTTAPTKGSINACPASTPLVDAGVPMPDATVAVTLEPWPGGDTVVETDLLNQFGDNLSGFTYEPAGISTPSVLWGVLNAPSLLYRFIWNGSTWGFDANDGWATGKSIKYLDGTGNPDSESVARAESASAMYVSTERNNDASSVSRLVILRVDTTGVNPVLTTTNEWTLTAQLPVVTANAGLEGLTWIPDSYLTARGFVDANTLMPYVPASYPNHGTGLFVVGVEGTGSIHAFALDHVSNVATRIATFASGNPAVMGLEFDRETGALWAQCDNTCGNRANVLGIVGGSFAVRRIFGRPAGLPDSNNEGIAMAPESECVGGFKSFFWSDDSHFAGHAIRTGRIPCGPLF